MEPVWCHYLMLFAVGVFAGVNNVLAGGGSLVTMPILIFLGLDAATANGTNRLAIAIQNVFAVSGFRKHGFSDWKFGLLLTLPALPGVLLGVFTAVSISDAMFKRVLSVVMLLVLVLILAGRKKGSAEATVAGLSRRQRIYAMLAFAGIGFYSGFIQAGVGFIVMGSLTWITGLDLVRINSIKVFVIGILTWIAVVLFALNGNIVLSYGLALAAGTAIGGRFGSYFAVIGGEKWIKRILVIAVFAMAIQLSGIGGWLVALMS